MEKVKRVLKFFLVYDLHREENWLREMANKGWFLHKATLFGLYTFHKGSSKDTIYKIDFNNNIKDEQEYYNLFLKSGWQLIDKIIGFRYFKYTGDVTNYSDEVDIYNEPVEKLQWLRKRLIIFLMCCSIIICSLYSSAFLADYISIPLVIADLITVLIFSFISIRFISSYKTLRKKIGGGEYKEYYNKKSLGKIHSIFSIMLIPVLVTIMLLTGLTMLCTVSGTDKGTINRALMYDSMKKVDYTFAYNEDSYRICLYGSNDAIGILALDRLFLNRYKVVTDCRSAIFSDTFIYFQSLKFRGDEYFLAYGEDDKKEINKLVLIYADGSEKEIDHKAFKVKDNHFMLLQSNDKFIKQIKLYNKDDADITDEFVDYQHK